MNESKILLVEDDEITAHFIEHTLAKSQIEVIHAADAETGWTLLETQGSDFAVILLDRQLPGMDGMSLLRKIKSSPDLCDTPVIMETAEEEVDSIRESLKAGAYYYLTKPLQPRLLQAVIGAAITDHRQIIESKAAIRNVGNVLLFLELGTFHCRTLSESKDLAQGLVHIFPDPARVALGLQELLLNAIEHGNLGISYDEKTKLLIDQQWTNEVERRLALPEYRDRTVCVTVERKPTSIQLTIKDQGLGFDWQKYLDFAPERAFDPHGRGIAMSRMMSFDSLEYQGNGNTVIVEVRQGV